MKNFFLLWAITAVLASNVMAQSNSEYWVIEERTPRWALKYFKQDSLSKNYKISDFINPFYLEEDFNGDSFLDIVLLIENIKTEQKGFVIIHGNTKNHIIIGAGHAFGNDVTDYSWMDVWKVHRSAKSYNLIYAANGDIEGSKEIQVHDPSLQIIKTEASRSLLYWNGNEYKWARSSE